MLAFIKVLAVIIVVLACRYIVYPNIRYESDPYKIIVHVGKPGTFKTTEMIRLALDAIKHGRNVYCNTRIPVEGVEVFKSKDYGQFTTLKNSLVLFDEASDSFDNRQFKSFSQGHLDELNDHRHNKVDIHYFCQTWSLDKKIRDRASYIVYHTKISNTVGCLRLIIKRFGLKPAEYTADSDSQMVDVLEFAPFFSGGFKLVDYEPYFKYTDTHATLHEKPLLKTETIHITETPVPKNHHLLSRFRPLFKHKQSLNATEMMEDDCSRSENPDKGLDGLYFIVDSAD